MPRDPVDQPYTATQAGALWLLAGGALADVPMAVGTAQAESGLRNAVNASPGETSRQCRALGGTGRSVGPWQINWCSASAQGPWEELLDPMVNARRAVAKRASPRGWGHWTLAPQGEVLARQYGYLTDLLGQLSDDELRKAAQTGEGGAPTPDVIGEDFPGSESLPDVLNPLEWTRALGMLLTRLLDPNTWKRLGLVIAGAALVFAGAVVINRDTVMDAAATAVAAKAGV